MTSVSASEFFSITPEMPLDVGNTSAGEFFGKGGVKTYAPKSEEEKLGFVTRVGNDLKKRLSMQRLIASEVSAGNQSFAEGMLQVGGKVGAGAAFDFMGEVLVSAGRGLSNITPDVIEQPMKDAAISAGHAFLNTEIGRKGIDSAMQGVDAYAQFSEENPRAARNIEAVVNIGLLAAPVKGKPKADTTVLGKTALSLEKKALEQTGQSKANFVKTLVMPKQTAAVRTEQVGRTAESGLLRSKQVGASKAEEAIAKTVSEIPEVSGKNTLQGNYNVINQALSKEAESLSKQLIKNDVAISRKEILEASKKIKTTLADNPLLVGDAEKVANKIISKMDGIIKKNGSSASGLLKSRKELDAWIKSQKGKNIFDPKNENAISIALREVRQSANDLIAKKVPSLEVKESLRAQSNMYRALENIAPKAADEASNVALRAWQNVTSILPFRGEFNQTMAVLFGVGGLGASAMFAPFFTKLALGGIVTYGVGRAVMSAPVKKGLSLLLKESDKAIRATKDANLIKQLRADRALVVEILKDSES